MIHKRELFVSPNSALTRMHKNVLRILYDSGLQKKKPITMRTDRSVSVDCVKQSDLQINVPVYFIIARHAQFY